MIAVSQADRWFIDQVLPHAAAYLRQARRWATDDDAARDIVQEAYVRVIGIADWRSIARPKAYVLLIVRNVAIDRLRQARLTPFDRRGDHALLVMADDAPDAFAHVAGRQRLRIVRDAIAALPTQRRKCVEMRKFQDLGTRQIADRLGLSVSTVETHLSKGLKTVMQALDSDLSEGNDQRGDQRQGSAGGSDGLGGAARRRNRPG